MNYCWILMLLEEGSPKGNTCTSDIQENSRVFYEVGADMKFNLCVCRIRKIKSRIFSSLLV
jgi:hypothetical protein